MGLLFYAKGWKTEPWIDALKKCASRHDVRQWPQTGDMSDIDYALVWKPPGELFENLPNLKVIFSLGAGVDHLLNLPGLPDSVPIVRVVAEDLTARMSEYVLLHVLMHHRRQRRYDNFQRDRIWREIGQPAAGEMRVGIMGLGELGRDAAEKLRMTGFQVAGWSRSEKSIEGIKCYHGANGLKPFLGRADILVCMLPLTEDTRGILNRDLFRQLAHDGAGDGPVLINAGRGGCQVDADIVAALDAGELYAATLDVFEQEPLPADSPLWNHERVSITPHNAAVSDPMAICAYVCKQIEAFEAGGELANIALTQKGY